MLRSSILLVGNLRQLLWYTMRKLIRTLTSPLRRKQRRYVSLTLPSGLELSAPPRKLGPLTLPGRGHGGWWAFEDAIKTGTVDQVVHSITPKAGDSIFIPSGRLHAIGAGLLIYEIQQNSDTTYRVFDWNRMGLDGQPRELHIDQSLSCIDFSDIEPEMDKAQGNTLASCPYFRVDRLLISENAILKNPDPDRFSIVTVISGELCCDDGTIYRVGDFLLLPRNASPLKASVDATVLQTSIPHAS